MSLVCYMFPSKESAEAVLNELLTNARADPNGTDHALNFHLAKVSPQVVP